MRAGSHGNIFDGNIYKGVVTGCVGEANDAGYVFPINLYMERFRAVVTRSYPSGDVVLPGFIYQDIVGQPFSTGSRDYFKSTANVGSGVYIHIVGAVIPAAIAWANVVIAYSFPTGL
jgi:hypothetical protein